MFRRSRNVHAGAAALALLVACGRPVPGDVAGCYRLDWSEFADPRRLPDWLVPDAVLLTTVPVDSGEGWHVEWGFGPDTTRYGLADAMPWHRLLERRAWTPIRGGGARIELTDVGINAWTITLLPDSQGFTGDAEFRSRLMGGDVRTTRGTVHARPCATGNDAR